MASGMKVNRTALKAEFDKIRDFAAEKAESFVNEVADDAIMFSTPHVDTGAYITSFSITKGAGRPRGKQTKGLPRKQVPSQKAQEGRALLAQDVSSLDYENISTLVLRNGSPHAIYVENGGNNWKKAPAKVCERLRIRHG